MKTLKLTLFLLGILFAVSLQAQSASCTKTDPGCCKKTAAVVQPSTGSAAAAVATPAPGQPQVVLVSAKTAATPDRANEVAPASDPNCDPKNCEPKNCDPSKCKKPCDPAACPKKGEQ